MASFGSTERIDRRVQNVTLAEKPDTVLRKNLCSRKLNENGANSMAILRLSGRRQNRDCSRNCNCQSLQEPQTSTDFNDRHATGSISISYKPQLSTDFNNSWNLVRDQGVGGSNPLSPTNVFNKLQRYFFHRYFQCVDFVAVKASQFNKLKLREEYPELQQREQRTLNQ